MQKFQLQISVGTVHVALCEQLEVLRQKRKLLHRNYCVVLSGNQDVETRALARVSLWD